MICSRCKISTDVVDSRWCENKWAVRRRRVCPSCNERFTTYERNEQEAVQKAEMIANKIRTVTLGMREIASLVESTYGMKGRHLDDDEPIVAP